MIQARNITKWFGNLQVLKGIDLDIQQGQLCSVVGPSGAGKTTLLQILGTLSRPDSGTLLINEQPVFALPDSRLATFRNLQIGFVFQFHYLLPEFTALENVCIPAWIAKKSRKEATTKATELLNRLGLADRLTHKPAQLSGGERQRVAVARALINNPLVIFADEPSGNLDSQNKYDLHELFFHLRAHFNQTLVIVTHDEEFAAQSDRIIRMKDGIISEA
ncbi:MAG: ABC transporter ATP-binding protein [Bacteroidales bacterium]|jgi:lipoprotein-releasing system ATP-binding protein|nr:ABC transporter ATP-binding protein [Bacteroidales bacterium]